MPKKPTAEKLTALERRKAALEAKIRRLKATEAKAERRADTQRKIIAGALALKHCDIDGDFKAKLYGVLDEYVYKAHERSLFELSPLSTEEEEKRRKAYTARMKDKDSEKGGK